MDQLSQRRDDEQQRTSSSHPAAVGETPTLAHIFEECEDLDFWEFVCAEFAFDGDDPIAVGSEQSTTKRKYSETAPSDQITVISQPVTCTTSVAGSSRKPLKENQLVVVSHQYENHSSHFDVYLPDVLVLQMSAFLDAKSLAIMRLVDRRMCNLMTRNEAGWSRHCSQRQLHQQFWKVPPSAVSFMQAYATGVVDSRRQEISVEELCFDDLQTTWWFRFKTEAGIQWTANDPWHAGEPAQRVRFDRTGRVLNAADERGDYALGGANTVRWYLITQPLMDDENRPIGAYLRLNWNGRDVPTYIVRRNLSNGGFIMENCWGIFTTYKIPLKLSQQPKKHRRTTTGSTDVTGRKQWREAMMYNYGDGSIPHGPTAMASFRVIFDRHCVPYDED